MAQKEQLKMISYTLVLAGLIYLAIIVFGYSLAVISDGYRCSQYSRQIKQPTELRNLECFVYDENKWVTQHNYVNMGN